MVVGLNNSKQETSQELLGSSRQTSQACRTPSQELLNSPRHDRQASQTPSKDLLNTALKTS